MTTNKTPDAFDHPVQLKITNLDTGETETPKLYYEKGYVEKWIIHQKENMGSQFHKWEIVEVV